MSAQAVRFGYTGDASCTQPTRARELPVCPICRDSVVAAEASALRGDLCIQHLWTCETCGYGFVTEGKIFSCAA